jgi:hypothetical protein
MREAFERSVLSDIVFWFGLFNLILKPGFCNLGCWLAVYRPRGFDRIYPRFTRLETETLP